MESDLLGLVETSTNWNKKSLYQRYHNNIRSHHRNFHFNNSRNSTICEGNYLPRGTIHLCTGSIKGRISKAIHDDKQMGRWSGHKLQLQDDQFLYIVISYGVCKASNVSMTSSTISSYRQQYMILQEEGEELLNPRKQFITDMNAYKKLESETARPCNNYAGRE